MRLPSYQDLSKEQDSINNLPLDGSYLVTGPPGTGKTVMALYRSAMLQAKKRTSSLLMFSKLLSQYTDAATSELLIDGNVQTYHSWIYWYFRRRHGIVPPSLKKYYYDWPELLRIVNASPPPDTECPDLIVDEGQDLPKEFYIVARLLSKNLTVFADENQRLRADNSTITEIRQYGGFGANGTHSLTRNYRNTAEIAALSAHYFTGLRTGIASTPERHGDLPVVMRHHNLDATVDFIRNYESANSDLEIGVLTPTSDVQKRIIEALGDSTINPVQYYRRVEDEVPPELDFDRPGIKVVNYQSGKGLEFDTVFMPALNKMHGDPSDPMVRMTMYVMTSRARSQLYLSYWTTTPPRIVEDIPEGVAEWRT